MRHDYATKSTLIFGEGYWQSTFPHSLLLKIKMGITHYLTLELYNKKNENVNIPTLYSTLDKTSCIIA